MGSNGMIRGFAEGMKRFEKIKLKRIENLLLGVCDKLVNDAWKSKDFWGFTGNTQTSFSCGLYLNGRLSYIVSAGDQSRKPVRLKVPKGKWVYLANPYEGNPRSVKGKVGVDTLYGQQTASNFLRRYKAIPRKGFAIVMTTGTEYSVYLEEVHDLNVLTDTYGRAREVLLNNMKPIA